jgi:hypothetical protein
MSINLLSSSDAQAYAGHVILDSSAETPASQMNNTSSPQLQLRMGQSDGEKDKAIVSKAESNERKFKENERLKREVAELKRKQEEEKAEIAQLESELAIERGKTLRAEREVLLHRQAGVQPIAVAENVEPMTCGQTILNSICTAGSFCRRHENLFIAALGIAGGVLALVFAPHAVAIGILTGAAMALFKGIASFF